jgi:hypothetical protein
MTETIQKKKKNFFIDLLFHENRKKFLKKMKQKYFNCFPLVLEVLESRNHVFHFLQARVHRLVVSSKHTACERLDGLANHASSVAELAEQQALLGAHDEILVAGDLDAADAGLRRVLEALDDMLYFLGLRHVVPRVGPVAAVGSAADGGGKHRSRFDKAVGVRLPVTHYLFVLRERERKRGNDKKITGFKIQYGFRYITSNKKYF